MSIPKSFAAWTKKLIAVALVALWCSSQAASTLPVTDHFAYASSGNLGSVGAAGNWKGSSLAATMTSGNLDGSAVGLSASSGNMVAMSSSTGGTYNEFASASGDITSGKVYCSFLLKVNDAATASTTGERVISMNLQNGSSTRYAELFFKNVSGAVQLGIAKNGGTPVYVTSGAGANVADGAVYLVVFSQEFVSPGTTDDIVKLWVNPASLGGAEDSNPKATISTGGDVPSATGAGRLYFSGGVACNVDEFRMATTWADVTPSSGPVVGSKLAFTSPPNNAAPGATLNPVVVQIQSSGGAAAASNNVPVTLSLSSGTGTLGGTLTQNTDASGKATFSDLTIDLAGAKQLTATASGIGAGLTAAVSGNFDIVVPSVATKLAFTSQPADAAVNATLNAVVVQVQDANSLAIASNDVPVTLTLSAGSGILSGTLTRNTDATGKATFNDLSLDTVGGGNQLSADASGIGAGLASALSATFTITSGGGGAGGLVITQAVMLPVGFKVAGSAEQAGTFTQILGSTDAGVSQTNWVIVSYQNAGAGGQVNFTNPVSPAMPHAVYRLRTGNTVTKLEPPSIGTPPVSQIVSPGTTATFSVTAVGPQLQYLWYFNGKPISGATASSLVIPNAQAGNAGNYQVVVANPAGNLASAVVTLGVGNIAPNIVTEPLNQTVSAGGTAIFTVTATGTSPMTYQWFANTNNPLSAGTNATLTVTGVSTNDSGNKYRVVVSNGFGTDTSVDAALTVTPVPTDLPETNVLGWAAFANVTGGAGGVETNVSTYPALRAACRAAGPIIIKVEGVIVPTGETYCYIEGFDKTIVGVGTNSGLSGYGFRVNGTNIIIANMSFNSSNPNSDGVTIDNGSHGTGRNVWVDHCTFYDCTDGSVDVTKGGDYVTVSWCKFHYAPVAKGVVNHEFVNLIASSDSDNPNGLYHVTFHHNWYGSYCRERMPSVRFGRVHVFNNYYDCFDNNYCVRTRIDSEVLVENNYFLGVQNPWERFLTTGSPGLLKASGNITNNCTFVSGWVSGAVVIPGTDTLGAELNPPPYPYTLTPAGDVPYYIQNYAGHGKYPYAP